MNKKNKNKLYTLSYFRKRLRDAGITSKVLIDSYTEGDKRYWTISIDPENRILCTCFKYTEDNILKFYFNLSDGNQNLPIDKTIKTESMNVIIEILKKIINK
jgi:hypothetical protein